MNHINFILDGWAESSLEEAGEARTLVRLKIAIGDILLTRNFSKRGGGSSDSIHVPLLPLAQALADRWWLILYEPFRAGSGPVFKARHRLDVPMHGYTFPALSICSAGNDSLLAAWAPYREEYARIEFLTPPSQDPEIISRDQAETTLMDLIETTLDRIGSNSCNYSELALSWDRVKESIGDPEELAYCRAAGRLGFDPYDPSGPDLTKFASQIETSLFEDIADAAFVEELQETTDWVRSARAELTRAPTVNVGDFGECPVYSLSEPAWRVGTLAAEQLRNTVNFNLSDPRKELERLFGEVLLSRRALFHKAPPSVNALLRRHDRTAQIGTIARTAREQRFKACAASYLAWDTPVGEERAATPAFTRRQQASRAFAAEMLAPREFLRDKAPQHGFTSDQIERIAGELICPYDTIVWQSVHANIPLRGIELPISQHPAIV